ncbi:MAG: tyrosine-type recombinase/integrase, partial [Deltaproteobacteria bacterium]|nr:tyrosine-type recombinase/integrase [Deltaproteobacteria bacterium]
SIATHMLSKDINLRIIQQYLGHRQVQTTEFYTHVGIEHLKEASNKILCDYNNILKLQPLSNFVTTEENG